ncbi:grpE protein homolog 1, mitochondrial [Solenopsis invicta]|uniref:grpE protein homolog 1, mitochondrial n=1 Tax=Solenopsis invicta TaxID=13686 RepID=UPI0001FEECBD|nr:grpE protein homolog 1, mitochondrial [Solenopsis invicta]XP_011165999.1 grpE protein homolog 1, mitochondrial [Solenopsis invicta]XP_039310824.1 grpE protein homolog 1, mitochondrial [Solenopsis invicta]
MVSIVVPAVLRFSRVTVDNLYQMNKSGLRRLPRVSTAFSWQRQHFSTITEEKKPDSTNVPPMSEATENEKKLKTELELINKELAELKESKDTLEDKYKRALAEGENIRVRLTKQINDAKLFGIQGFCKDLLDVADVLGKATESVPKDEITERNPHLKGLYEGLVMTEAQLHKVFKKHGLVSLNPVNEKFDPNEHEALFQQEVEGKEPGTIVVVSKVGYKLHERIVRPALVGVAKG